MAWELKVACTNCNRECHVMPFPYDACKKLIDHKETAKTGWKALNGVFFAVMCQAQKHNRYMQLEA